jgi:hypothetical protein
MTVTALRAGGETVESTTVAAIEPASVPDGVLQFSTPCGNAMRAFVRAQKAMAPVLKQAANDAFKGKKYAELTNVLDAILPALADEGFAIMQAPSTEEIGGAITVETLFIHESTEWIRSRLSLTPTKTDPQGAGSAITYARRYSLLAMAGVAPEDDDGNGASGRGRHEEANKQREDQQAVAKGRSAIDSLIHARAKEGLTADAIGALVRDMTDGKVSDWTDLDSPGALRSFYAVLKNWQPPATDLPNSQHQHDVKKPEDAAVTGTETAPAAQSKDRKALVREIATVLGIQVTARGTLAVAAEAATIQADLQRVLGLEVGKPLKDYTAPELAAYLALKADEAAAAAQQAAPADSDVPAPQERVFLANELQAQLGALISKSRMTEDDVQALAADVSIGDSVTYDWRLLTPDEAIDFRDRLAAFQGVTA